MKLATITLLADYLDWILESLKFLQCNWLEWCSWGWPLEDITIIATHLQLWTLASLGVSAFYHKTPSADAGPPRAYQTWVCFSWSLGNPYSIYSFQPQQVTAYFSSVGKVLWLPSYQPAPLTPTCLTGSNAPLSDLNSLHFHIPASLLHFSCKVGVSPPFPFEWLINSILPGELQLNSGRSWTKGPDPLAGWTVEILDGKVSHWSRSTHISQSLAAVRGHELAGARRRPPVSLLPRWRMVVVSGHQAAWWLLSCAPVQLPNTSELVVLLGASALY